MPDVISEKPSEEEIPPDRDDDFSDSSDEEVEFSAAKDQTIGKNGLKNFTFIPGGGEAKDQKGDELDGA